MKARGSDGTNASRQRDIAATMRTRLRTCDVEDSHPRAGRVAQTNSHWRRMAEQGRAPHNIQRQGSRDDGWTRDPNDELIIAVVKDV